jgi:ABC-type molybdate transport system substrate-binding protein
VLLAANGVVYTEPDPVHGSLQALLIDALLKRPDYAGVHRVTIGANKNDALGQGPWDFGLTLVSELPPVKQVKNVEFAGPLPEALHAYIDFAVAVPAGAAAPADAAAFIGYLRRPESAEVWRATGAVPQ